MDERQTKMMGRILRRFEDLKREKSPWNLVYDFIAIYIMMRRGNFSGADQTVVYNYDVFLPDLVFDSTAIRANYNLASSLIGSLWPSGGKTFKLQPPLQMSDADAQSEAVKTWYEQVTLVCQEAFDDYEAGFQVALEEYFNDQGSYGTSGIGCFEDDEDPNSPILFECIDTKRCWIAEGKRGLVDTVYRIKVFTLHQLEEEYGFNELPASLQEKLEKGEDLDRHVKVLIAIEPRIDRVHGKTDSEGNDGLPIASIHYDMDHTHVLRESGYDEMPAMMTRFWKHKGEVWGRSPALAALPDIMELNSTRQASIVAIEKFLDPPLLTWENSMVGGGVIDTTAGVVNVAKQTGRAGQKPVEQMIVTGELNSTYDRMGELEENILDMFFSDKLADLSNEQRQTLGEANIRNEMRKAALSNVFARQIAELFIRLISRVFNILLRRNRLGFVAGTKEYWVHKMLNGGEEPLTIPEPVLRLMLMGSNVYRVIFLSPAARILRQEELNGIMQLIQVVVEVGPIAPTVADQLNWDRTFKSIQDLTGASTVVLNSNEEVSQIRKARNEQQQALQNAEMQSQQALTAKHGAQAAEAAAKAGATQNGTNAGKLIGLAS